MDKYIVESKKTNSENDYTLASFYNKYSFLVKNHVNAGKVNYYKLAKEIQLDHCFDAISHIGPKKTPNDFPSQKDILAYYCNVYNLVVMYLVIYHSRRLMSKSTSDSIDHDLKKLIDSVKYPKSPLGIVDCIKATRGYAFFICSKFCVDGEFISLYKLEHGLIRKFNDCRIHTAINCASIGCPRLQSFVFGMKIGSQSDETTISDQIFDDQLEMTSQEFSNSDYHVKFDFEKKQLSVSKIFQWYKKDFAVYANKSDDIDGTVGFLLKYGNQDIQQKLNRLRENNAKYKIVFHPYDWNLNYGT